MNDYDYVVLFDENGQPYIAHSWRDKVRSAPAAAKNAGRQAVKYIEKIVDKGKTRYFYTQDELRAYYDRGKEKARRAVDNARSSIERVTGADRRKDVKAAERAASRAERELERKELKAEKAVSRAREIDSNGNRWYDTPGEANLAYNTELAAIRAGNEAKYAAETVEYLKDRYGNSPLGRVENAINSAKDIAKKAKDTVSRWGSTTLDSIGSAVDSAKEKASDAVNNAKNAATNAVKDTLGYGAKERAEQARKNKDRAEDEFFDNGGRALSDFNRRGSDRDSDTWKNADAAGERRQADMDKALLDYSRYSDEYIANRRAYQNSPAAAIDRATDKVKTITASAAKSLQEKWAAGKELTQTEMNQLMSFLMKDYK